MFQNTPVQIIGESAVQITAYASENCQPIFAFMARIALNARLLIPDRLEGIGWFTHEIYKRIIAHHPEHEFLLIFDRKPDRMFDFGPHVQLIRLLPPARRPFLYDWWFNQSISRILKSWCADVFVSTDGMLSMRTKVPQIAVMHDLNFMHHPEWMPIREARYYRSRFPRFAQKAARIITVSEFSRQDIHEQFGIDRDLISVVGNAPAEEYKPLTSESVRRDEQEKWTGGRPYYAFVGSLHPRKNVNGLLEAFKLYRHEGGVCELVIVGGNMWSDERQRVPGVHYTGRLDRASLAALVGASQGLIFLPWFEGFGVPLVEAFACGVPVIASNVTAMPEICGEAAAALVAPSDAAGAARAMRALDEDAALREDAVRKGLERAAAFSWEDSARRFWEVIENSMKINRVP